MTEGPGVTWRAAPSQEEQMYGKVIIDATLIPCIELETKRRQPPNISCVPVDGAGDDF